MSTPEQSVGDTCARKAMASPGLTPLWLSCSVRVILFSGSRVYKQPSVRQIGLLHGGLGVPSGGGQSFSSFASSWTQRKPSHFRQYGQSWVAPVAAGSPQQCQPALTMPTPGLATTVEPSSLTVAGPMLTK